MNVKALQLGITLLRLFSLSMCYKLLLLLYLLFRSGITNIINHPITCKAVDRVSSLFEFISLLGLMSIIRVNTANTKQTGVIAFTFFIYLLDNVSFGVAPNGVVSNLVSDLRYLLINCLNEAITKSR